MGLSTCLFLVAFDGGDGLWKPLAGYGSGYLQQAVSIGRRRHVVDADKARRARPRCGGRRVARTFVPLVSNTLRAAPRDILLRRSMRRLGSE
jgi:hypothetical protein